MEKKLKKETSDIAIKDTRNLFKLENKSKAIKDRILRDTRSVFRLEKEYKTIKGIILKDIRIIFENEEEQSYYKPIKVSNVCSDNCIEYESNSDRNKAILFVEYLN